MKLTRRDALAVGGATVAVSLVPLSSWAAVSEVAQAEIDAFTGGAAVADGGVTLTAPEIAENGNTVPIKFAAPGANRVLLLATGNPGPAVAEFEFSSMSVPQGSIRIRLAGSQDVMAIAQMADGSFTSVTSAVKVTIGGCGG